MRPSLIATSVLVLGLGATSLAGAQSAAPATPVPIVLPTLAPNTPNGGMIQTGINILKGLYNNEQLRERNNVHGTVTYFKRFDMQVQYGPNQYRSVRLHQGTIINPRGATPGNGSIVDVNGYTDADGTLEANAITIDH